MKTKIILCLLLFFLPLFCLARDDMENKTIFQKAELLLERERAFTVELYSIYYANRQATPQAAYAEIISAIKPEKINQILKDYKITERLLFFIIATFYDGVQNKNYLEEKPFFYPLNNLQLTSQSQELLRPFLTQIDSLYQKNKYRYTPEIVFLCRQSFQKEILSSFNNSDDFNSFRICLSIYIERQKRD
jgi:hypothetical protein